MTDAASREEPAPAGEESPKQRQNRQLAELLQGFRVAVTGVQVLFAFLLTVPFSAGFAKVDLVSRWLLFVALMGAALATICFIAPVAQHRVLFRTQSKETLLRRSNRLGIWGSAGLSLSIASASALVVKAFLTSWLAAVVAAAIAFSSVWLWFVQPLITRQRARAG